MGKIVDVCILGECCFSSRDLHERVNEGSCRVNGITVEVFEQSTKN